jgi:hypothetical protein
VAYLMLDMNSEGVEAASMTGTKMSTAAKSRFTVTATMSTATGRLSQGWHRDGN